MKRILLLTILVCAAANANASPAPVSPLQPRASSVSEVEAKSLETQKETDLLKNIDAILSGKFDKASEYRPPLPLTQKAWSRQKTETKAGTKIFVWSRGKTFKVTLREGMGTLFKLPDWDGLDQSVLADSVNFRQKEMNNSSMIYVEALSAGADEPDTHRQKREYLQFLSGKRKRLFGQHQRSGRLCGRGDAECSKLF